MKPRVSVLLPVYNGERYLSESIESILQQTFSDFELIIINDGSTDGTGQILAAYAANDKRVVLIYNEKNIGLAKSLNKGLEIAQGEYIARQDADDVSYPERFAKQIEYLDLCCNVGLLGTASQTIDKNGNIESTNLLPTTDAEIRWHMLFENQICHTSVIFRRHILDELEIYYNETPLIADAVVEDYELWSRLLQRTRFANLSTPLVCRRTHYGNTSTIRQQRHRDAAAIISGQSINALMVPKRLTQSEINILRKAYYGKWLTREEMSQCITMKALFDAFIKQNKIHTSEVTLLRRRWLQKILFNISPRRWSDLWSSRLFISLVRVDPVFVLASLVQHICSKFIGSFF